MLFSSVSFLVFLPIVFVAYWLTKSNWQRNLLLVVASYWFYACWDWRFCCLLALMSLVGYGAGLLLDKKRSKAILIAVIVFYVGALIVFKYANFFIESVGGVLCALGFSANLPVLRILLPVGVSFYTFQLIGYVTDVYKGTVKATEDVLAFEAFVSFFPRLAMGPIEQSSTGLTQFLTPRRFEYEQAADGCRQMLWGFFKKIVIADQCGVLVDRIFLGHESYPGSILMIGAILYAFQLYGDFSGYSDIAIGCGRLFGFQLSRNFAYPYFARNVADFWRRWHMSLMTWLRDYIYIPLGGSRCGMWKRIRNVFVVFLVSGLWHGANWTFVIWGVMHACLFIPLLLLGRNRQRNEIKSEGRLFPNLGELMSIIVTFVSVSLLWIVFRSPDLKFACSYLSGVFSPSFFTLPREYLSMFPWVAVLVLVEWVQRKRRHALEIAAMPVWMRWPVYFMIATMCVAYHQREAEFIYFQF